LAFSKFIFFFCAHGALIKEGEMRERGGGRETMLYCDELAHTVMEAEMFHNLQFASWRTMMYFNSSPKA
jgi:hypothetical protein